jgi:hypothetical protein
MVKRKSVALLFCHTSYHDKDCTPSSLCSAMEKRSCTVRRVITSVRWKRKRPLWLRAVFGSYETHVSSSSYSYQDAVQRGANSCHIPPLHSCLFDGLNVGIVLRHPRLCNVKLNNYWRLLILVFVFTVYKRTLFYVVDFYCLCINWCFICYNREVFLEVEPTL